MTGDGPVYMYISVLKTEETQLYSSHLFATYKTKSRVGLQYNNIIRPSLWEPLRKENVLLFTISCLQIGILKGAASLPVFQNCTEFPSVLKKQSGWKMPLLYW